MKLIRSPLYLALALLTQCSSCKDHDPSPEQQLPPATQTGANTFGCLINGQAYLPAGYDGTSNYAVLYDPGYNGGTLDIRTYNAAGNNDQYLSVSSDGVNQVRTYSMNGSSSSVGFYFRDAAHSTSCALINTSDNSIYRKGSLTITRLDLQAGIISGTFEAKLAKPGCDTVRITQGRFDKKL
ncbi:hypothetical protein [Hymenobacter metallilatus]|uniref:Uncharacterized protein n=1 Tax=Hymenobacter metallilatus TaxID=2493666 RepID=A0A3R9NMW3_9BACT|nr:hypothetical protein [Hymenobacter metallilatus]RSK37575.1 hypothetical protein EI290_02700 [Hymenobacter metallilatus]